MILKQADDKTEDLKILSNLLLDGRLSKSQHSAIEKEIQNIRTGDLGERDVAYFLNYDMKDSTNNLVMHDVRLEMDDAVAQIDHLVIGRAHTIYVLETKNLRASMQCNESGEWTAWYGAHKRGTPVAIASPIEQARRHVTFLDKWLRRHGWTNFKRIEPVVVVSPTTFVGKTRAKGDETVAIVRADLFRRWWENDRDLGSLPTALWRIGTRLSLEQLEELGGLLLAEHRPLARDWPARFGLEEDRPEMPRIPSATPAFVAKKDRASLEVAEFVSETAVPSEVVTVHGPVSIKRVTDGRYALRHGENDALKEHVKAVGSVHGIWQARFKNWLVPAETMVDVLAALTKDSR